MRIWFLGATLALALSGCATKETKSAAPVAAGDDWVTLPPVTGSNLPRRVRRSELQTASQSSPVDTITGQALMDQVRPSGPPPNAKGN